MKKIKRVLLLVFTLLLIDTNILRADDYNGNSGEYDSSYSLHIKYDIAGTLPSGGGSSSGGGSTGTSSSGYIMSSAVMLKANLVNQDTLKVEGVYFYTSLNDGSVSSANDVKRWYKAFSSSNANKSSWGFNENGANQVCGFIDGSGNYTSACANISSNSYKIKGFQYGNWWRTFVNPQYYVSASNIHSKMSEIGYSYLYKVLMDLDICNATEYVKDLQKNNLSCATNSNNLKEQIQYLSERGATSLDKYIIVFEPVYKFNIGTTDDNSTTSQGFYTLKGMAKKVSTLSNNVFNNSPISSNAELGIGFWIDSMMDNMFAVRNHGLINKSDNLTKLTNSGAKMSKSNWAIYSKADLGYGYGIYSLSELIGTIYDCSTYDDTTGTYYDNDGNRLSGKDEWEEKCNTKCVYKNGNYYDSNGDILNSKEDFLRICGECVKRNDKCYLENGEVGITKEVSCDIKEYSCIENSNDNPTNRSCEKINNGSVTIYYDKDGKITNEKGFQDSCGSRSCSKVGSLYYGKDGSLINLGNVNANEREYQKQCLNICSTESVVEMPDTCGPDGTNNTGLIEDPQMCTILKDERTKAKYKTAFGNDYCDIYCRNSYTFRFMSKAEALAGRFFQYDVYSKYVDHTDPNRQYLSTVVEITKECTSDIDYDKWKSDFLAAYDDVRSTWNEYNKALAIQNNYVTIEDDDSCEKYSYCSNSAADLNSSGKCVVNESKITTNSKGLVVKCENGKWVDHSKALECPNGGVRNTSKEWGWNTKEICPSEGSSCSNEGEECSRESYAYCDYSSEANSSTCSSNSCDSYRWDTKYCETDRNGSKNCNVTAQGSANCSMTCGSSSDHACYNSASKANKPEYADDAYDKYDSAVNKIQELLTKINNCNMTDSSKTYTNIISEVQKYIDKNRNSLEISYQESYNINTDDDMLLKTNSDGLPISGYKSERLFGQNDNINSYCASCDEGLSSLSSSSKTETISKWVCSGSGTSAKCTLTSETVPANKVVNFKITTEAIYYQGQEFSAIVYRGTIEEKWNIVNSPAGDSRLDLGIHVYPVDVQKTTKTEPKVITVNYYTDIKDSNGNKISGNYTCNYNVISELVTYDCEDGYHVCPPGKASGETNKNEFGLYFRNISLNKIFNYSIPYNWSNTKGSKAIEQIERTGDTLWSETPAYSVTLSPSDISSIKRYNKDRLYLDNSLSCNGYYCTSNFLDETLKDMLNDNKIIDNTNDDDKVHLYNR